MPEPPSFHRRRDTDELADVAPMRRRSAEGRRPWVTAEIESQPECWSTAARLARSQEGLLPPAGARVLAVGCGTSYYVAKCYAALREEQGFGVTDAAPASEVPLRRSYDVVLVITRSGTTTEVLRALDRLEPESAVAVVGDARSPVAVETDRVVALDFADERSIVQTRFATTALALLRAHLGDDLEGAIAGAHQALAADLPRPDGDLQHLVVLGRGWTVGLAEEGALKCREAAGMWSEAYAAMEYRHGPISAATERTLVWSLGSLPEGLQPGLSATGAEIEIGGLDPLAELVRVQRQAVASGLRAGRDPDAPAHLQRSVVLGE